MLRPFTLAVLALGGAVAPVGLPASEFEIHLKAAVGARHQQVSQTEESPSSKPARPRPTFKLAPDQPIVLSWQAENTSKSQEFPDVLMHFFVVEEKQPGQAAVPKLTESVAYEGALTMDFKPHGKADWKTSFRIHEPGNYLVRVETMGMAKQHGHEHYVAMDLEVK